MAVVDESVEHVGDEVELSLCCLDLLLCGLLWSTTEAEEGHDDGCSCSCSCSCSCGVLVVVGVGVNGY